MNHAHIGRLRELHASTLRLLEHARRGDMEHLAAEAEVQQALFAAHTKDPRLPSPSEHDEARRLHREILAANASLRELLGPLHRDLQQLVEELSG